MSTPTFNTPKLRQRIDIVKDFEAIDAFAREKGIPTLVAPDAKAAPATPEKSAPQLTVVTTTPVARPRKAKASESDKRAQTMRLIAELPDYLVDDIKSKALKTRCTVRYLLAKALKADGYEVREADLYGDGRGLR